MDPAESEPVNRLWRTARFLPQTVRLLGTRYRTLFLAYAQACRPTGEGDSPAVADALAFADFLRRQDRVGLLDNERKALDRDERMLRRRFRLKRDGASVSAIEKWKILQWVGL